MSIFYVLLQSSSAAFSYQCMSLVSFACVFGPVIHYSISDLHIVNKTEFEHRFKLLTIAKEYEHQVSSIPSIQYNA